VPLEIGGFLFGGIAIAVSVFTALGSNSLQKRVLQLEEARDRRAGPERRAAIASALLFEIAILESSLLELFASPGHEIRYQGPYPLLSRVTDFVDVLDAAAMHQLMRVATRTRLRSDGVQLFGSTGNAKLDEWAARSVCADFLNDVEKTREALVARGGIVIDLRTSLDGSSYPELPTLPPRLEALVSERLGSYWRDVWAASHASLPRNGLTETNDA